MIIVIVIIIIMVMIIVAAIIIIIIIIIIVIIIIIIVIMLSAPDAPPQELRADGRARKKASGESLGRRLQGDHFVVFSDRLSKAYITNPWAPVKWITAPHRVTMNEIKNQGRKHRA